ncbi:hypothetical protein F2Q68_00025835, partial [Brassica cretica]
VFLCFGNSVASTCFLLQDEFNIQTTQCDNCIIVLSFPSTIHIMNMWSARVCRHNTSLKWTKEVECLDLNQWACQWLSRCPVMINMSLLLSATLLHHTRRLKDTLMHLTHLLAIPSIEKL